MSSAYSPSPSLSPFPSYRPIKTSFSSSQGKCNAHSRPLSDFARICLYSFSPFVNSPFSPIVCPYLTTSHHTLSSIFIIFCKNIFGKRKRTSCPIFFYYTNQPLFLERLCQPYNSMGSLSKLSHP